MELTADNVYQTLMACLYHKGEDQRQAKEVQSVKFWGKFDPIRVAGQRANILAMLSQLPAQFRDTHIAQGASFLLACEREDGVQWGEHTHVDWLLALGLGVDVVHFPFPRELWPKLPMGVPSFILQLPVDHIEIKATLTEPLD